MENHELLKTADGAALAYLGDCVFELWVRERLLRRGLTRAGMLNAAAHDYVTAKNQSAAFYRIESLLTEEERSFFPPRAKLAASFCAKKRYGRGIPRGDRI